MGRYSTALADPFLDGVGVLPDDRVIDVGCGTGALTSELVARLGAANVAGCDPSVMLEACRARCPGVDLRPGAMESLPFDDATFDLALAQLVVHFASDPEQGIAEMGRVVGPGGRVAASAWAMDGGMQLLCQFWDAALEVDPAAPDERSHRRFGREGELPALFAAAGLGDVVTGELEVRSTYADYDELWATLVLGVGTAGAYLVTVPDDHQQEIRRALFLRLGRPEGAFSLAARARTAAGTVSG